jgi:hypothetical protein
VALFGATVTGDTPGYFPVENHRPYPLVLSVIALAVMIAGLAVMIRDREFWRREWLQPQAWAVIVLGAVAITTLFVALTQRPRAEYMYGLTVGLLALVGLGTSALLRRLGGTPLVAALTAGLIVVLCVALPSYYHRGPRPLYDAVERLQVVRGQLRQPSSVLVTSAYNFEICAYLAESSSRRCTAPSWSALASQVSPGRSIRNVLNQAKATVIYADPLLHADRAMATLLTSPEAAGWRQVAAGCTADGRWSVLIHSVGSSPAPSAPVCASRAPSALRDLPGDLGNPGLAYSGIYEDGWVKKNALVVLAGGAAANLVLRAQVLPREGRQRQHLQVLLNGRVVASRSVTPGLLDLQVPVPASRTDRRIELHWEGTAPISPNDQRRAAALLSFLGVT